MHDSACAKPRATFVATLQPGEAAAALKKEVVSPLRERERERERERKKVREREKERERERERERRKRCMNVGSDEHC
jgi:hypothetical protein